MWVSAEWSFGQRLGASELLEYDGADAFRCAAAPLLLASQAHDSAAERGDGSDPPVSGRCRQTDARRVISRDIRLPLVFGKETSLLSGLFLRYSTKSKGLVS